MHYRALFFLQAAVILVIGVVHVAALRWSLYWHFIWLDLPMHFLGGAWVALISVWFLGLRHYRVRFFPILFAVLLVGIGWEIFEHLAGVPVEDNFVLDTSLDLFMDLFGGICGFLLARRLAHVDTLDSQVVGTRQGN